MHSEDRQERFERVLELIYDLLEELRSEFQAVRRDSVTDPLTGLANRRVFERRLEEEVSRARRYGHPLTLVLMDIDHFKRYNDVYGHRAGDEVLRHLGWLIGQEIREPDVVSRYGGEEFALLLPETDIAGARRLVERLRRRITNDARIPLTLSFGLAEFPSHADDVNGLLQAADEALYAAKDAGRDAVCGAGEDRTDRPRQEPKPAATQPARRRGETASAEHPADPAEGRRVAVGFHLEDGRPVTLWRDRRVLRILEVSAEEVSPGETPRAYHVQTPEGAYRLVRRDDGWYLEGQP